MISFRHLLSTKICHTYLETADEGANGIGELRSNRSKFIPILLQTVAHSLSLSQGRCQIEQDSERIAVLWTESSGRIVSVHSNIFKPESFVELPFEGGGILSPGFRQRCLIQVFRQVRRCCEDLQMRE